MLRKTRIPRASGAFNEVRSACAHAFMRGAREIALPCRANLAANARVVDAVPTR
jgi:hypothetical protein